LILHNSLEFIGLSDSCGPDKDGFLGWRRRSSTVSRLHSAHRKVRGRNEDGRCRSRRMTVSSRAHSISKLGAERSLPAEGRSKTLPDPQRPRFGKGHNLWPSTVGHCARQLRRTNVARIRSKGYVCTYVDEYYGTIQEDMKRECSKIYMYRISI
jgi:hypothetical protein